MAVKTDLQRSTFQNKPAYRYLRATDRIPTCDASRATRDPLALVKLFNPTGVGTWYIAAYDADTRSAFGAACVSDHELGYIDMAELVAFRGRFGLPLERDLNWTPRPLSECGA